MVDGQRKESFLGQWVTRPEVETIRRVIKEADRIGIKYITLYAFSTENWRRPQEEVTALMKLLVQYLKSEVKELHKNEVSFKSFR